MRTALVLVSAALVGACASSPSGGDDDSGPDAEGPPPPSFTLTSPPVEIIPLQEITYCWYFRTPNDEAMAITKLRPSIPAVGIDMVVYTTTTDKMPVGSVTAVNCGATAGATLNNRAVWTYASYATQSPAELELPADDGTGQPLAIEIAANQAGFMRMHFKNTTDQPQMASMELHVEGLQPDVPYTKTAAYVTYNQDISIPPNATNHTQGLSCSVSPSSKFWMMTTRTHKQSVHTAVKDGAAMVVESSNYANPNQARWFQETPFRTFESGKLTYECTWTNPTNRTITDGEDADYDEVCMASGYFFPANDPVLCFNSSVQ